MSVQTVFLPGLSPLARGTRHTAGSQINVNRFIPAGAGNTLTVVAELPILAVYPRWRGEHLFSCLFRDDKAGLSPLARGTRLIL